MAKRKRSKQEKEQDKALKQRMTKKMLKEYYRMSRDRIAMFNTGDRLFKSPKDYDRKREKQRVREEAREAGI